MAKQNLKGWLPTDYDNSAIQVGNRVMFEDGANPTVKSPLTIAHDGETIITIPTGAIAMVLKPVGTDVRVAAAQGECDSKYGRVTDGESDMYDCAGMTNFYLKRHTAVTLTVYFRFIIV